MSEPLLVLLVLALFAAGIFLLTWEMPKPKSKTTPYILCRCHECHE